MHKKEVDQINKGFQDISYALGDVQSTALYAVEALAKLTLDPDIFEIWQKSVWAFSGETIGKTEEKAKEEYLKRVSERLREGAKAIPRTCDKERD